MGCTLAHVLENKKTGRLSFRRAYPPELIPFLPIPAGQSAPPIELKRSLKSKRLNDPVAMHRFNEASAEWEANVALARKKATATFDRLDNPTIEYFAALYAQRWHEDEAEFLSSKGPGAADSAIAGWEERLGDFIRWRGENEVDLIEEEWGNRAEGLLASVRFVRDPKDATGFQRLCMALNDAAIKYSETSMAMLGGAIIPPPPVPQRPSAVEAASPPSSTAQSISFEDIAESILENPLRKVGPATRQAARTALRFFRESFGSPVPSKITKAAVTEWLKVLGQRPAKLPANHRALPLQEVVDFYKGKDVPRMSSKTIMTHLGALAALWTKAQEEDGFIPETLPNPFKARKYLVAEKPEEPKQLSLDELHAIFSLPIFTIGERPVRGKGEASYWLPLMLLWTGARPEELAQLMVHDFFQDTTAEDGCWFMRITDEGEHPHKGPRRLKTSKGKKAGRREFPVPQPLLDLNIIGYVEHVKASGETALFPKLRTKGERGLLFTGFSEWWNGLLQDRGILPAGQGRRGAREFRHNWTTAARAVRIPEDAREYIQGHYRSGVTANQDYGSRKSLGLYIDQLRYEGLDLSRVKPWRANSELSAD
jgi:integrase